MWSLEAEKEDKENKVDPEVNTMTQFAAMASSISNCLKFTFDSPKLNRNQTMPVLEPAMWVGREKREIGIPPEMIEKQELITSKVGQLKDVIL